MNSISEKLETAIHESIVNLQDPLMALLVLLACLSLFTTFDLYFSSTYSLTNLIVKVMQVGFYMYLLRHWDMFLAMIKKSAEELGRIAGGAESFLSPTELVANGVNKIFDAYAAMVDNISLPNFFDFILLAFAFALTLFGLYKIAFILFMTNAEFLILGGLSLVLLPFGVLRYTESIAEKVWGILLTSAVKVMVAIFMVCLVGDSITDLYEEITDTINTSGAAATSSLLVGGISLVFLSFLMGQAVEFAGAMTSGMAVNTGNILHSVVPGARAWMAARLGGRLVWTGLKKGGTAAYHGAKNVVKNKILPWWRRITAGA